MEIDSAQDALTIAEQVLLVLEDDVVDYFQERGIAAEDINSVGPEDVLREKISGDSLSVSSELSLVLPGEPSTLRLFYEKGVNIAKDDAIPALAGKGVDEECEVVLHRTRKYKRHGKPPMKEDFSQTKAMAFIPEDKAGVVFQGVSCQQTNSWSNYHSMQHVSKFLCVIFSFTHNQTTTLNRKSQLGTKKKTTNQFKSMDQ